MTWKVVASIRTAKKRTLVGLALVAPFTLLTGLVLVATALQGPLNTIIVIAAVSFTAGLVVLSKSE